MAVTLDKPAVDRLGVELIDGQQAELVDRRVAIVLCEALAPGYAGGGWVVGPRVDSAVVRDERRVGNKLTGISWGVQNVAAFGRFVAAH